MFRSIIEKYIVHDNNISRRPTQSLTQARGVTLWPANMAGFWSSPLADITPENIITSLSLNKPDAKNFFSNISKIQCCSKLKLLCKKWQRYYYSAFHKVQYFFLLLLCSHGNSFIIKCFLYKYVNTTLKRKKYTANTNGKHERQTRTANTNRTMILSSECYHGWVINFEYVVQ